MRLSGYRTILASSIAATGGLLGLPWESFPEAQLTVKAVLQHLDSLLSIVGGALAIYYRLRAEVRWMR